jgi:hypothetical protein
MDLATGRTLGKLTQDAAPDRVSQIIAGLFSLGVAFIAFGALTVIAFWISFGRRFSESWRASSPWTRLVGRIFAIVVIALVLLVVFGGASNIKDRWLTPFFFLLPLYLCLKLDALNQTIGSAPKRFGWLALIVLIAVPIALYARVPAAQYLGRYAKLNVPYGPAIDAILATGGDKPSLVVVPDMQLAGNVRLHAEGIPVLVPGYERFAGELDAGQPILLIWRDRGRPALPMPEVLSAWHAAHVKTDAPTPVPREIARPYHYGRQGDVYHFGYAWIHPAEGT